MKDILAIAQIAAGIAAIVSLLFTMYVYRIQKINMQLAIAMNISSWNIEMPENKTIALAKEGNPEFYNNGSLDEWHNTPNCSNITFNNNPFPMYNLITSFIPNSSNFFIKSLTHSTEFSTMRP